MARLNGTIKRLMSDKGFGFVASEGGNEYFFHQSACSGVEFYELHEGQAVAFDEGAIPTRCLVIMSTPGGQSIP